MDDEQNQPSLGDDFPGDIGLTPPKHRGLGHVGDAEKLLETLLDLPFQKALDCVYAVALGVCEGDRSAAEELCQNVFIKLIATARSGGAAKIEHPYGYLAKTTRNMYIEHWRKGRRRREELEPTLDLWERYEGVWQVSDPARDDVPTQVIRRLDVENLERALRELTPEQRVLVKRIFVDDMSVAAAARSLHISEGAARYRLAAALTQIETIMRRHNGGGLA